MPTPRQAWQILTFGMEYCMTTSKQFFCKGFLQGSLLGCGLVAIGFLSWIVAILAGSEKDISLSGFSIISIYVLSFGLGGGTLCLLRKSHPRWYETVIAWGAASAIVLLGCGVLIFLTQPERPITWFWGVGGSDILFLLFGVSLNIIRKSAESGKGE